MMQTANKNQVRYILILPKIIVYVFFPDHTISHAIYLISNGVTIIMSSESKYNKIR